MIKTNKYVKTNMGLIPLEDYLDIRAQNFGYDNYEDMIANGVSIEVCETSIITKLAEEDQ